METVKASNDTRQTYTANESVKFFSHEEEYAKFKYKIV